MVVLDKDEQQARLAGEGDMQSFEELYHRHKLRVYSLCLRMTHNITEAEDLTQEIFCLLFRKIKSFNGTSRFTTWLYRVTVNFVLMHLRKPKMQTEEITENLNIQNPYGMPAVERITLEKAISQLSYSYRIVFLLHDVEGYKHPEIAQLLGYSVGTSKFQLHMARLKLRTLLMREKNITDSNGTYG